MPTKPLPFNRFALIALRNARNLTRDEVATGAGCDPGNYGRLESGKRGASQDVINRLAAFFGCDPRALNPEAVVDDAEAAA